MGDVSTATGIDAAPFDPFAIAGREDRYAVMAEFRSRRGHAYGRPPYPELDRALYVFTNELIHSALKHPALLQAPPGDYDEVRETLTQHAVWETLSKSVLLNDPPQHEALRRPMTEFFSRRNINRLEAWLQGLADDLMAECLRAGRFDITQDFAVPFAVGALSRVLGLPIDDPWHLKRLTAPLSNALDMRRDPLGDEVDEACIQIIEMIEDGIRRRGPSDTPCLIDVMEDLVARGAWTRDTLIGNCVIFYFAGQETVVDSLGSHVLALNRFPAQKSLLSSRPDLTGRAVEELLRFEPPVQYSGFRIAAHATRLHGIDIAAGEAVVPVVAAGNRDPAAFDAPEELDITRTALPHISFGTGIHICLGIHLAKLELKIALKTLFQKHPNWQLTGDQPVRRPGVLFNGYTSVPAQAV